MTEALKFEWVRLSTVRSTYWLLGLAVVLPALLTALVGFLGRDNPMSSAEAAALLTGGVALMPLLPLPAVMLGILGVLAIGHEYRHNTIRPTLSAFPRRSSIVAAKVVVIAATCAVTALFSMGFSYLVLLISRGSVPEIDGTGRSALFGYVVLLVLWGVVGMALTLLTRQTAVVLPLLVVIPLMVEPLLAGLTFLVPALEGWRPATRFLPFTAGTQLAQSFEPTAPAEGGPMVEPLTRVQNGAVFAAFSALVLAPAWLLFESRDA